VDALFDFLKAEAACDPHLADQLILPMALAPGTSRLTTSRVTRHLLSTVQLAQQLLGCPVQVGGEEGSPGQVTIEGAGGSARPLRSERGQLAAGSQQLAGDTGKWRQGDTGTRSANRKERLVAGSGQKAEGSEDPEAVVRKARAEDVPAIQKLVAYFAARGELLPRTLNEIYQHLRDFFVCELHGEVVGIAALSLYWEDLAEVRSLAVAEGQGGKGLGAALVNACLEEAARLGIRRVFALTYRPGFFEKLGFQGIDKRALPQKIWKDCIRCAKFACCDEVALIRDTCNV
jgi:amino-acid N-acetyltransferase